MIKTYYLQRNVDHSGNSGTGKVAQVFELEDVGAVLVWGDDNPLNVSSVVVYKSVDDLIKVHGHGGDTVLVPQEISDLENFTGLCDIIDTAQDAIIFIGNELFEMETEDEE